MRTFLEFIEKRSKRMVTEAFNDKDVNKMNKLVENISMDLFHLKVLLLIWLVKIS